MPFRKILIHLAACCVLVSAAYAQPIPAYPSKAIRMVVPSAPSGGTDLIARLTAQKVGEAWGRTVLVDNVSGGSTRIGINAVAKSAPDGYTWLLTTVNFAFLPAVYLKLTYDPVNDFTPVILLANSASVLVVHPSMPTKSVKELIVLARSRPGEIRFGTGGAGSVGHLVSEMFQAQAKVSLLHVPYKGTGPSTTAVLGGETHMLIANMAALMTHARSGRLRALAVTTVTRAKIAPELPTMVESGLPDYEYSGWYGLWTAAKTSVTVVRRINEEFNRTLGDATLKTRFAEVAIEPAGGAPDKFTAHLAVEFRKWDKVAKGAGIKLD
jgi:tripartite-type tricarboxylate transporter receptor subunit TctC